jgi:predicted Zn-dependent peptidase
MYHIFVKTPLYKNSNFVPHLVEHCMLPKVTNPKEYFEISNFFGNNYTYYSDFILETDKEEVLNNFLDKILMETIDEKNIKYERKVIKSEVVEFKFRKQLINKI